MQQLLHLVGVLLVESEDCKQRAEEKDLSHQGLDDTALKAGDQGHHQQKDDQDVDNQGAPILEDMPSGPVTTGVLG